MPEKKRKKTRFIAHFDGYYRLRNNLDWLDCYVYDISETGASISVKQNLVPGDKLEICLDTSDKSAVVTGVVANVVGQIIGIKFSSENFEDIIDGAVKKAFIKTRKK